MNAPTDTFPLALIALMKGVVYQEADASLWQALLTHQGRVRDHVAPLGLELLLDEAEGYACLRQRPAVEGEPELPRLVPRRQLGYGVSLLLALLRRRLAEADQAGGDTRLVLRREDLLDLVRVFQPDVSNEARWRDRFEADVRKVEELGFLHRLRGSEETYEVRRILKAYVDAQWLDALEGRLAEYREHLQRQMEEA